MKLEVRDGLGDVDPQAWDTLVGDGSPFLEWGWLKSLEESGCVAPALGWLPLHLTLWDGAHLVGACPLYLKAHSEGEFIFDHGWAAAAERGGIPYYPKLLVAIPFTPVTGTRLLSHPESDRTAVTRMLGEALKSLCRDNRFSSVHVNFCLPDEVEVLAALGFEHRAGYQFQWSNPGWGTFDDYLAALRAKRRNQIKRERRALAEHGIEVAVHTGDAIPDSLFEPMFRLYKTTVDRFYWGRQYLNTGFFDLVRRYWKPRLCFIVAQREDTVIAGTFNVRKGETLYGRYWGTFEEVRYLHFNVCYYAAIEHCVGSGISRFEPGAGGEFKHLRGFDAHPTASMHFLANPRLERAVHDYLIDERRVVAREMRWLYDQSAFRR